MEKILPETARECLILIADDQLWYAIQLDDVCDESFCDYKNGEILPKGCKMCILGRPVEDDQNDIIGLRL